MRTACRLACYSLSGIVAGLLAVFVSRAEAIESADLPLRTMQSFSLDGDTLRGYWAEMIARYQENRTSGVAGTLAGSDGLETRRTTVGPRLAYGTNLWEAGLMVPFESLELKQTSTRIGAATPSVSKSGLGDVEAYARAVPFRLEHFDFGGGMQFSFPTGDHDKGLGSGEFGILPFATALGHWGRFAARVHAGYEVFTGQSQSSTTDFFPADGTTKTEFWDALVPSASNRLNYGGSVHVSLGSRVALRAELLGTAFPDAGDSKTIFSPGFDCRIPIESLDILIRPTASVGLTHGSPDWGFGGSVVLTRVAARPAPPPPAIPAPVKDLVVLLEQPDGKLGALTVTTRGGSVDLTRDRAAAEVAGDKGVTATALDEASVLEVFGATLAAQPAAPYRATVHFATGRVEPSPESLTILANTVAEILRRQSAEVTIIGHTDRVGSDEHNERLSLRRANVVRDWIIARGVTDAIITDVARGETVPAVLTPDEIAEPKNRRVEILVR